MCGPRSRRKNVSWCRYGMPGWTSTGTTASAFSIIKVSRSNQTQESSCSLDSSTFIAFSRLFWVTDRKWIKDLYKNLRHESCEWIRTKDDMRNEPEVLGQCLETYQWFPTNQLMRVTGSRGCTFAMPRAASKDNIVPPTRTIAGDESWLQTRGIIS
jgi:hypothetical protein